MPADNKNIIEIRGFLDEYFDNVVIAGTAKDSGEYFIFDKGDVVKCNGLVSLLKTKNKQLLNEVVLRMRKSSVETTKNNEDNG